MRVITGIAGGRKLKSPEGESVRPTTDHVKQAMFNIATANCGIHSDGKTYTNSTSKYYDCFNHIAVDTT